ncbi:MAG: hypothetical protein U0575_06995 [Phycisphaerales bacterium]
MVALILTVVGERVLAAPRCRGCGYDLRTFGQPPPRCPECGADLSAAGQVRWHTRRRRRKLAFVAVLLFAGSAIVLLAGRAVAARRALTAGDPAALANASNGALIDLFGPGAMPCDAWLDEVKRRFMADRFDDKETALLVDRFVRAMTSRPDQDRQPRLATMNIRAMSKHVIAAAAASRRITDGDRIRLAQASTDAPQVSLLTSRTKQGSPVPYRLAPPALSDFGIAQRIAAIRVDGHAVDIGPPTEPRQAIDPTELGDARYEKILQAVEQQQRQRMQSPQACPYSITRALAPGALSPGAHVVEFDVERVFIDGKAPPDYDEHPRWQSTFEALDSLPDPPGTEDRRLARDVVTLSREIVEVGENDTLRASIVDPARREAVVSGIRLSAAEVLPSRSGSGLAVRIHIDVAPSIGNCPIVMIPTVRFGAHEVHGSTLVLRWVSPEGSIVADVDQRIVLRLAELDPSIRSIDVILTPDLHTPLGDASVDGAWGEPIEIKDVPLVRKDL